MKALLRKLVGWVRCFKVAYYTWYNKMYFGFRGIHFGDSMQVFNKIYVVGAKDCVLSHLPDMVLAKCQDVCVCAEDDAEVSVESGNTDVRDAVFKVLCNANGAAAGAAAAVRR